MAEAQLSIPIIDSHVHLYGEDDLDQLSWMIPEHPLRGPHTLEVYNEATGSPNNLRGFVFIETDRKNGDGADWEQPLQEISMLKNVASEDAKNGPTDSAKHAKLLAIIPWAPLQSGPAKLEEYLDAAQKAAGQLWPRIKGFRYLLQYKPNGTMLCDDFIESLKLLGRKGYVFEVGIDQHRRGRLQLEEAVDMIDRAHDGVREEEKVVFILNHLCKPDLSIINPTDPSFIAWRTAMFTLSKCKQTYMKLSGAFSEMPDTLARRDPDDIFMAIYPWLAVALAAFSPSRLMFGSDWPVSTLGVGPGAWTKWQKVVERMCYMASLETEDQYMIWGGTAAKAYGIDLDSSDLQSQK